MKNIKVGDTVEAAGGRRERTIVRHIGHLGKEISDKAAVWGEWEREWDGKLLPNGEGGGLTYIVNKGNNLKVVKRASLTPMTAMNSAINEAVRLMENR